MSKNFCSILSLSLSDISTWLFHPTSGVSLQGEVALELLLELDELIRRLAEWLPPFMAWEFDIPIEKKSLLAILSTDFPRLHSNTVKYCVCWNFHLTQKFKYSQAKSCWQKLTNRQGYFIFFGSTRVVLYLTVVHVSFWCIILATNCGRINYYLRSFRSFGCGFIVGCQTISLCKRKQTSVQKYSISCTTVGSQLV